MARSPRHGRGALRRIAWAGLALAACSGGAPPPEGVSAAYLARAEATLERARDALRPSIGHYGLVFDVSPEEFERSASEFRVRGDGHDLVMGGVYGIELHGGGVLGLLLDYWRPGSRRASLGDRYAFAGSGPVALGAIERSHRQQIFLPVPGREREAIGGALPGSPQLPRMRFAYAVPGGREIVEADSFTFLRILVAHEPDPEAEWTNRLGQRLSVGSLLGNAWDHYVTPRPAAQEFDDHSYLHMPEVLLAFWATGGSRRDPNTLKRRFLETELRRTAYGGYEASEALGHYVEGLGWLLAVPEIVWSTDEKQQVLGWLRDLETSRLREVESLPPEYLTHLVRGLRMLRKHRARLR